MEKELTSYKKNDLVTIDITDMDEKGQGIGKAGGFPLFVKDAVVGDTVLVKVMKAGKNYGFAKLVEISKPSPDRIQAACPVARACGGCQLQELSYEAELRFKENKVKNNLIRLGGFSQDLVEKTKEPVVGMEGGDCPYRYRNKAQYPIGTDKNGEPVAGFYAGRTHDIISNTDCLLGRKVNERILKTVLGFVKKEKIKPYNETTNVGELRHVLIREGFTSGEIMVCFVVNGTSLPKEQKLCEVLTKEVPQIASIVLNVNKEKTNVIMGKTTRVLWGKDTIDDTLGGVKFKISAKSFYQVNPVMAEKLYGKALEYAALSGMETVWDLYCGIGTISLFLAKAAGKVYGVEIIPEAINDAKENAAANDITNVEFFVGKAEEVLPEFYNKTSGEEKTADQTSESINPSMLHPDVIVVDPPRKGCDGKCLETLLQMGPKRIVYVSCDSATLARDLRILCAEKYELKAWQCYDQFCKTIHTETVALLCRK